MNISKVRTETQAPIPLQPEILVSIHFIPVYPLSGFHLHGGMATIGITGIKSLCFSQLIIGIITTHLQSEARHIIKGSIVQEIPAVIPDYAVLETALCCAVTFARG